MECEVALTAWTNNPARLGYFEKTVRALRGRLTASRHTLTRILVCSEGLPGVYRGPFEDLCKALAVDLHYHPGPPEVGCNHNFLLSLCRAPYVLFTEDDCYQHTPLDLSDDIDFLGSRPDFIFVRYSLSHPCRLIPLDPPVSGLSELDQTEPYPYSNRAHLRHRARFASLGPFTEHGAWGAQEIDMGDRVRASQFKIAGRVPNCFDHIGRFASQEHRWPPGASPC